MTTYDAMTELADADLVSRSLGGDRDAFSQIVLRYQTLVCSLAYNILGNLGESEDAAQETFIVAWKRLRHLREPVKLRAWLCGIVSNRARDRVRRESRDAGAGAEALDAAGEIPSPEALPSEQAISAEEQAILWRALCRVPETYREPLILFYRERQSVERVAAALELTEDAVKQRLSRGRKLLHQEVIEFVEGALRRTAPDRNFTAQVLSALPLGQGLTAAGGVGVASKGAAAKSGGMLAAITGTAASFGGLAVGLAAQWLIVRSSPSPREKRLKLAWFAAVWAFALLAWGIQPGTDSLARHFAWKRETTLRAAAGIWWLLVCVLVTLAIVAFRWMFAARQAGSHAPETNRSWAAAIGFAACVYAANVFWVIGLAWRAGDEAGAWTVAGATALLAGWHVWRRRGANGVEALRITAQQVALVWGMILLTINLRLDVWGAALNGLDLAKWRQIFPPWALPALTVALAVWACGALVLTRPRAVKP